MATLTVAQGQVLDWTLLDDTGTDDPYAGTGEVSVTAGALKWTLRIVVAHTDTNDGSTNYVTVSVMVQAGSNDNDEDWREILSQQAGGGQATAEALDANSGSGQANPEQIKVAATTDWDTGLGENLFLLDAGILADSCLVKIRGWSDADYYINAWELENAYDSADSLFDGVDFINVQLPEGTEKYLVTFHNSDGDATYAVRVDYDAVLEIG